VRRHLLFVTPPAPGHVHPTLALVERLVARGHRVSYVTSPALRPAVTAAGASAVDLNWEPETGALAGAEFSVETLVATMWGYLNAVASAMPTLLSRFERGAVDVVCSDAVVLGPLLAGVLGVPMVSLLPNFATNEHVRLAEIVPGFDPAHPALREYGGRLAALFAEYGLPAPADPTGGQGTGLTLVFLPREFQIAGDSFDDTYRFIGPSIPRYARASDWVPPRDGEPVVLVSLGTAFTNRPQFFATCVEAFRDPDWHVVMAVGEHVDPGTLGPLPASMEIASRVPQLAVLRHATVFVSHAGMGSTMESLYHQVPLVAVPQAREQVVNARRVVELGLGRCLDAAALTAEQLREAVDQVAADPAIRDNLATMKKALDAAGGANAGAEALERYLARSHEDSATGQRLS